MSQDRHKKRNQLIRQALHAARQRIDAAGADPDAVFAPVGEALFWIVAADEGLKKQHGQAYRSWRDNHQHGYLLPGIR